MKIRSLFESESIFTPEQLKWCKDHVYKFKEENFQKDRDGFSVTSSFDVYGDTDRIPFKLYSVNGIFSLGSAYGHNDTSFKDMTYFPIEYAGSIYIACDTFSSFKGASGELEVSSNVSFESKGLTSLSGIGDAFSRIAGDWIEIPACVDNSILGILKFNAYPRVLSKGQDVAKDEKGLVAACTIIKKHYGQGKSGVVKAQRELIEADLDNFAEL